MPTNLTDSSTWTTPVAVPTDGDPVAAGSGSNIRTTFQTFANRTKYLYDILTSTGITKIRKVTSTASLKGLTSPVEGDVAILATGGTPQIFLYRSTALAGSDLTNLRYDSTTATGYWISPWFYIASVSGGIRLDVQTLPPPNRVVSIDESGETSGSTTPTALGGVFGPTLSVTVETGDLVLLEGHCTFAPNGADADGYVSIAVDGNPQALANRKWDCANSGSSPLTPSVLYTAAADGTLTIRLYQIRENFASGTPSLTANRSLRATVYRPLVGRAAEDEPTDAGVQRHQARRRLGLIVVVALLNLHLPLGLLQALVAILGRQLLHVERLAVADACTGPAQLHLALEPRLTRRALDQAAAAVRRRAALVADAHLGRR